MPASFGYFQRKAIHGIASICGLEKWRLVNGSAAAAIGYPDVKSCTDSSRNNLLIVDLGGGTMAVSAVQVDAGGVAVLATVSHGHFGGEDIDIALLQDLQQVKECSRYLLPPPWFRRGHHSVAYFGVVRVVFGGELACGR